MNQSAAKETPCPDCGEMVRVNSLRCWNCGAFMNREVEERYMAMQANPSPTIFSKLPDEEVTSVEDDSDDDFELSMPTKRVEPTIEKQDDSAESSDSTESPSADATEGEAKPQRPPHDDSGVAHSVATGGDALLDIAMQEEQEVRKKQKGRKFVGGLKTPGGGLIIFCPYGCRVEVKEQHRGMTGRCPSCGAPFIVPVGPPQYKRAKEEKSEQDGAATEEKYQIWIPDLHLHVVDPEKLKIKADSLLKDFVEADVGFSKQMLLVALLAKKGGRFARGETKESVREAMIQHLREDKPLDELPIGDKYAFPAEELAQLKIVQPTAHRGSSIFHGIPVFGTGRIAIQLPLTEATPHPVYLSMGITEFWKFSAGLETVYGISGFGSDAGLPMESQTSTYKCHYTDALIKALSDVELYKADPSVELEVAGYQCGTCKIVVSEAGRKKENLGGKSPKGIAKAKCPKCGNKMGENLLYSLKQDIEEPSMSE